jgi:thiol-disulfide isomerase/thioredoxin
MKLICILLILLSAAQGMLFAHHNPEFEGNRISILKDAPEQTTRIPVEKLSFLKGTSSQLFVVIFLGTDCPISQKYMHTLKELHKEFEGKLTIFGLLPKNFEKAQIAKFEKDFDVPFELIYDMDNYYAHLFKATITPEVFLFDASGTLFYDGAIDNWFYALGRNRMKPTEFFLKDALAEVLSGKAVKLPHADAVGCLIEMKH